MPVFTVPRPDMGPSGEAVPERSGRVCLSGSVIYSHFREEPVVGRREAVLDVSGRPAAFPLGGSRYLENNLVSVHQSRSSRPVLARHLQDTAHHSRPRSKLHVRPVGHHRRRPSNHPGCATVSGHQVNAEPTRRPHMEATHYQYSPIETDRLKGWIAKWIGARGLIRQEPLRHRDLVGPSSTVRPLRSQRSAQTRVPGACGGRRGGQRRIRHRDRLARRPGGPGPRRSAYRRRPLGQTMPRDTHHQSRHVVPVAGSREHRRAGDLRVSARPKRRRSQVLGMDLPEPGRDGRCRRPDRPGGAGIPCPVEPGLNRRGLMPS